VGSAGATLNEAELHQLVLSFLAIFFSVVTPS